MISPCHLHDGGSGDGDTSCRSRRETGFLRDDVFHGVLPETRDKERRCGATAATEATQQRWGETATCHRPIVDPSSATPAHAEERRRGTKREKASVIGESHQLSPKRNTPPGARASFPQTQPCHFHQQSVARRPRFQHDGARRYLSTATRVMSAADVRRVIPAAQSPRRDVSRADSAARRPARRPCDDETRAADAQTSR